MFRLALIWGALIGALYPAITFAQEVGGDTPPPSNTVDEFLRMPAAQLWAILLPIGIPFVTGIINQAHWPSLWKLATWFVVCVVTTAVEIAIRGAWHASNFFTILLVTLVVSALTFQATKSAIRELTVKTTVTEPPAP
jgi:hypothetical protein